MGGRGFAGNPAQMTQAIVFAVGQSISVAGASEEKNNIKYDRNRALADGAQSIREKNSDTLTAIRSGNTIAKALGLSMPASLLGRADEVIE